MFKTTIGFYKYMKYISDCPEVINRMEKNMAKNTNDKAMEKLYKLTTRILKSK